MDSLGARQPPNNPLQRSVTDKVLGRGRERLVLAQVCAARVLERPRAAAERGRYSPRVAVGSLSGST
jgi:hypothetical protein